MLVGKSRPLRQCLIASFCLSWLLSHRMLVVKPLPQMFNCLICMLSCLLSHRAVGEVRPLPKCLFAFFC